MASTREEIDFDRAYVRAHGLYGFEKLAWHIVCPGEKFTEGKHVEQVCLHTEAALLGLIRKLIIEVPPGSTKSVSVAVMANAYSWGPLNRPQQKFLYTAYDPDLATRDAKKTQDLIQSEWFQERWPLELSGTAQVKYYTNVKGGFRRSCGIEGGITGRHPDVVVVDDPTNAKNAIGNAALMKTSLLRVQKVWGGVLGSRGADPKTVVQIIIMQRLHDEDLAGYLQSQAKDGGPKFCVLRLPMAFEAADPCWTKLDDGTPFGGDWRTEDGELLCEARWDLPTLEERKKELGNEYSAQYQQRPASAQGQIFQRIWFRYWSPDLVRAAGADPYTGAGFDLLICSWDFTFKDTFGSDFVCGQVWGKLGPNYLMLERIYRRMNFPNSLTSISSQLRRWPLIGAKLVEDKANGPAIISSLQLTIPGLIPVEPKGSKVARANAVSYLHRSGNVYYPPEFRTDTGDESHVECMAKFPLAKHDDSVDAETQALAYFQESTNQLYEALAAQQRAAVLPGAPPASLQAAPSVFDALRAGIPR